MDTGTCGGGATTFDHGYHCFNMGRFFMPEEVERVHAFIHWMRLGEDAFMDPAPRSAAAVVTRDAELLMLDRQCLESLSERRQREAWSVLYEIGGSLARQLRWTQEELRRLERW